MNREAHIVKRVTVGLLFAASAVVYGGGDSDPGANAGGAQRFTDGWPMSSDVGDSDLKL